MDATTRDPPDGFTRYAKRPGPKDRPLQWQKGVPLTVYPTELALAKPVLALRLTRVRWLADVV
jgi:hypothetical protein